MKFAKGTLLTLIAGGVATAVVLFFKNPPLGGPEVVVVLAGALVLVFGVNWLVSKLSRGT